MEDQQNGYIYETASPAPAVPPETLSQVRRRAGPPPPRTEETTP